MEELILINGKMIRKKKKEMSLLSTGLLNGIGLFETMRSYKNNIVYFDAHINRIITSCKIIDMKPPFSFSGLTAIIKEVTRLTSLKDAYIRLTLWKAGNNTESLLVVKRYFPHSSSKYKKGFSVYVSTIKQNAGSILTRLKTTSRLSYEFSFQEAKNKGFDEALMLNNRGYLAEGTRSNVFLIKRNEVFTPFLECGCLDGITRKAIFDLCARFKIKIYEANLTISDLYGCDGAFLTNSLMGVMPLVYIGKGTINKGKLSDLTRFLTKKYNLLLTHES